jgi:hypothetical protein
LLEIPEVFETTRPNEIQVNYIFVFRTDKQGNSSPLSISGKGRQHWLLKQTANRFVIIEENQQIFYRHYD